MKADNWLTARFLDTVGLYVWAVALLWLLARGGYMLLIRESLWPLLLGGLIVVFLFIVGTVAQPAPAARRGSLLPAWNRLFLLLLPLVYLGVGGAGGGLDSHAFRKRFLSQQTLGRLDQALSEFEGRTGSGSLAEGDGRYRPVTLVQIHDALGEWIGEDVELVGSVYRDDRLGSSELVVFRFLIVCCAADAIPVGCLVKTDRAMDFESDTWVRVRGELGTTEMEGGVGPVIMAEEVEAIPPPRNPYLSGI